MKYKTYVNNVQIFGDDEHYEEWDSFIKSQGIIVDENGLYDGYIKDFMSALDIIESILSRLHNEREKLRKEMSNTTKKCLFDLSFIPRRMKNQRANTKAKPQFYWSFLDLLMETVENAYCFLPYTFYLACKDMLEPDNAFAKPGHFNCWKLKGGKKIHVEAKME